MIAVLQMTNPLWEFLVAPGIFISIGYGLRALIDRLDSPNAVSPVPYDWADEEECQ